MKNYKVMATRYFRDSNEIDEKTGLKKERQANDVFYCTKERYEFLKINNAVKLVEVQETIDEVIEKEITEEEVLMPHPNDDIELVVPIHNETIDKIAKSMLEVVQEKPKKKKSNKK